MSFLKAVFYGQYGWLWRSIPGLLWMGGIFSASTQMMAHERTSRFVQPFLHWLFPGASADFYLTAHLIIRKGGHVAEYAILATLLFWAFGRRQLLVLLLCVLYAMGDEWHQSFVPGREGAIADVLIDTVGAVFGLLVCTGWLHWREKRQAVATANA